MTDTKQIIYWAKCAQEDIRNYTFRKAMIAAHNKDYNGKDWYTIPNSEKPILLESYQSQIEQAAANYISYCAMIGKQALDNGEDQ